MQAHKERQNKFKTNDSQQPLCVWKRERERVSSMNRSRCTQAHTHTRIRKHLYACVFWSMQLFVLLANACERESESIARVRLGREGKAGRQCARVSKTDWTRTSACVSQVCVCVSECEGSLTKYSSVKSSAYNKFAYHQLSVSVCEPRKFINTI